MNKSQIDFISQKIVQITNHIERQLEEKKALVGGFNDEIKASKKRVKAYARAVERDDTEYLDPVMDEFELAAFEKMGRDNG